MLAVSTSDLRGMRCLGGDKRRRHDETGKSGEGRKQFFFEKKEPKNF
jgi:hypothetical protein